MVHPPEDPADQERTDLLDDVMLLVLAALEPLAAELAEPEPPDAPEDDSGVDVPAVEESTPLVEDTKMEVEVPALELLPRELGGALVTVMVLLERATLDEPDITPLLAVLVVEPPLELEVPAVSFRAHRPSSPHP